MGVFRQVTLTKGAIIADTFLHSDLRKGLNSTLKDSQEDSTEWSTLLDEVGGFVMQCVGGVVVSHIGDNNGYN